MQYSAEDEKKYGNYIHIHLRKKADLPDRDKIPALEKKLRSKWIQLILNVVIILFFGAAYLYEFTTVSDTLFYVLCAVFAINMALLLAQQRQIKETITYLNHRLENGKIQ